MTGILLSTVVPAAVLGLVTLALKPPRAPRVDDAWRPGELAAIRALRDQPLSGQVLPPAPRYRWLPAPRPLLVVDADLGVLSIPPGRVGTPVFDRLYASHRLRTMRGYDWT